MIMAKQQELTDFEGIMVVGARYLGPSISEIVREFNILTFSVKSMLKILNFRHNLLPQTMQWLTTYT